MVESGDEVVGVGVNVEEDVVVCTDVTIEEDMVVCADVTAVSWVSGAVDCVVIDEAHPIIEPTSDRINMNMVTKTSFFKRNFLS
jgi:hypothetical protein